MGNGSGTPFSRARRGAPDFAIAGFLYGTVLLYLLGVETPYDMGAEFLSVRKRSATQDDRCRVQPRSSRSTC